MAGFPISSDSEEILRQERRQPLADVTKAGQTNKTEMSISMKLDINKTAFIRIDVVGQKYTFQVETVYFIYIFCSRFFEMETINVSAPG